MNRAKMHRNRMTRTQNTRINGNKYSPYVFRSRRGHLELKWFGKSAGRVPVGFDVSIGCRLAL